MSGSRSEMCDMFRMMQPRAKTGQTNFWRRSCRKARPAKRRNTAKFTFVRVGLHYFKGAKIFRLPIFGVLIGEDEIFAKWVNFVCVFKFCGLKMVRFVR